MSTTKVGNEILVIGLLDCWLFAALMKSFTELNLLMSSCLIVWQAGLLHKRHTLLSSPKRLDLLCFRNLRSRLDLLCLMSFLNLRLRSGLLVNQQNKITDRNRR